MRLNIWAGPGQEKKYKPVGDHIRQDKLPLAEGRYVGLVELFDTETGALRAIFPDGMIQTMRVGATNGIAAKYLSSHNSREVGLIGAGFQARMQLPLRRLLSPNG